MSPVLASFTCIRLAENSWQGLPQSGAEPRLRSGTMPRPAHSARVPRFYFHLRNDIDVPDDEGKELPDLEAALELAASQARKLAGEVVKEQGRITLSHRIDVEDEDHKLLATIAIRDVVRVFD